MLDVTELRRALLKADAAELASVRFLAAMNHEFRTPIGIVVGFADLLLQMAADRNMPHDLVGHLTDIRTAAWHLLGLVEDATRYTRIVQAGHSLVRGPVRVAELATAATQAAMEELTRAEVSVVSPETRDKELEIAADLPTLREGLASILREIARRSPRGVTAAISWQALPTGGALIRVRCTALVLPSSTVKHLLTPLDETELHSRGLEGAGLALAIADGAARAHGGRIRIESAPADGTCFSIELP